MKSLLLSLFLVVLSLSNSFAQIHVGTRDFALGNNPGSFKQKDIEKLKATTTIFVIPASQYHAKEDFEKAIAASWEITPFKVIKPSELSAYKDRDKYSFFSFGGYFKIIERNYSSQRLAYISYDLWMPTYNKKGEVKGQDYFARIGMFADFKTIMTGFDYAFQKGGSGKLGSFLNSSDYYNWGAGYLKGYLTMVNDLLLGATARGPYTEFENEVALQTMANDTLYLPDYINVRFNPITGKEEAQDEDDEALAEAYPFPVKMVSSDVLNDMILHAPKPFKYMVYVKTNAEKFINVYSSGSESLIYSEHVKLSFNFRNKDLKKLAKRVRKSS